MTKYALVVGINDYSVQSRHAETEVGLQWHSLSYCINDADSVYHLLVHAFDFAEENIILLKDAQAKNSDILSALRYLLTSAVAGDVVCFYYSGHGGILPATTASDNHRFYEAIVPYQGNWIYDFRLQHMANRLHANEVNFTLLLDCCHSGGMHPIDDVEQQTSPRSVPFSHGVLEVIQHMQTYWPFGICLENGSNELLPNVSDVQIDNGILTHLAEDPNKLFLPSAKGVVFSACNFYETALESSAYQHGYFTQALLDVVNSSNFQISHQELINRLVPRVVTLSNNHQTPRLRGQANRLDQTFLQGWRQSM